MWLSRPKRLVLHGESWAVNRKQHATCTCTAVFRRVSVQATPMSCSSLLPDGTSRHLFACSHTPTPCGSHAVGRYHHAHPACMLPSAADRSRL
eukprot:355947-Chlamydomonas_euryale.AAC.13